MAAECERFKLDALFGDINLSIFEHMNVPRKFKQGGYGISLDGYIHSTKIMIDNYIIILLYCQICCWQCAFKVFISNYTRVIALGLYTWVDPEFFRKGWVVQINLEK